MIVKYKASLPNNKVFMREYEFDSKMKLYKIHEFLVNDLGFAPDQMVVFEGADEKGKIKSQYGLFDMGDGSMDSISLEKILAKGETTLHYVYGMKTNRHIILSYLGEGEMDVHDSYPRLVAQKGQNPDQFSDHYEDYTSDVDDLFEEGEFSQESELPEGEQ